MKNRRQSVIPFAIIYCLLLIAYSLSGPVRMVRAFIQEAIKGSGKVVREKRPVSAFNAVVVSGVGELTAVQGKDQSVFVEAEDNIAPVVETVVKDSCLYIKIHSNTNIQPTKSVRYAVTVNDLKRIGLSGAVKAKFGRWESDDLKLSVSGASQATFDSLESKEITADLSGASALILAGNVKHQKLNLSGASQYKGKGMTSATAEVDASGACHAEIKVSDTLNASASGVSSIRYTGDPTVQRKTSGLASIKSAQ